MLGECSYKADVVRSFEKGRGNNRRIALQYAIHYLVSKHNDWFLSCLWNLKKNIKVIMSLNYIFLISSIQQRYWFHLWLFYLVSMVKRYIETSDVLLINWYILGLWIVTLIYELIMLFSGKPSPLFNLFSSQNIFSKIIMFCPSLLGITFKK